MACVYRF